MSKRPWYKRYPSNFLAGQLGIGPAQIGAYNVIVDIIYDRDGACPNDPRWIGGFLGCSPRMARSLIDDLVRLEKLYVDQDGNLRNERADRELSTASAETELAAENGAKGGRKSAENRAKTSRNELDTNAGTHNNSGLAEATLNHTRSQKLESRSSSVPKGTGGTATDELFPETKPSTPKPKAKTKADEVKALVYARGREVLGNSAGGVITNLLKTYDGNHVKALAKIEDAAQQRNPLSWINAFLFQHGPPGIEVGLVSSAP